MTEIMRMPEKKSASMSKAKKTQVGVLISGRGSNMQALIEAAKAPDYPAEITLVISNRPKAKGIEFAEENNIPVQIIDHKSFETRDEFDNALNETLLAANIELLCNAGFKRLLGKDFVEKWRNKQLNIHPSLLPAFKGLNTHERALETDVKIAGCTVHFVRFEMDEGPIIAQAAVPVLQGDTPETLGARVLKAEHQIYPEALRKVASGELKIAGERLVETSNQSEQEALFSPPIEKNQ
jgi:phosphoribosylglycinamide formyltransferase-1